MSTVDSTSPWPWLAVGGIVASACGMVPRIGLGRAAWIALRSRFAFKPAHESLRLSQVEYLKRHIANKDFGQGYLVVTGPKGIGKTCLVNTATSKTPGVINVTIWPGDGHDTVIDSTLRELTRMNAGFSDPYGTAKRVVFWHRLLTRGYSPVAVIKVSERYASEEYAELSNAVRSLVENYRLRVVVHGSRNSLERRLFNTHRQIVSNIKPMTKEMIWQIGQLQTLFKYIDETGLDDVVFGVLGGIPSKYEELWHRIKYDIQDGQNLRQLIGAHLRDEIFYAIRTVNVSCGRTNTAKLMKLFQETRIFQWSTLISNDIELSDSCDIFHEAEQDGIIPASNAIGIVLRHGLTKEPSLMELQDLIKPIV